MGGRAADGPGVSVGRRARVGMRVGTTMLVLAATVVGLPPAVVGPAEAQVVNDFSARFEMDLRGDITILGNANIGCSRRDRDCQRSRDGRGDGDNNDFDMSYVDADGEFGTDNSSRAQLAMPQGSTVAFAGLYWGARTEAGDDGRDAEFEAREVEFATPTSDYVDITATTFDVEPSTTSYQGFADVTHIVSDAGAGTYAVANISAATGRDRYAGWSLVVVYEHDTQPLRRLAVHDGFAYVTNRDSMSMTIDGFLTPPSGKVTARVGVVAYEGDRDRGGDQFAFNNRGDFGDALNPSGNTFNSSVTQSGSRVATRSPDYDNTMGFDVDIFDASKYVWNYMKSAPMQFTASGDFYYAGVVTMSIDTYVPTLRTDGTKSVVDLNGGSVAPGDLLEYSILIQNTGSAATEGTAFTDPIPVGTTYVLGTMRTTESTAVPGRAGTTWDDGVNGDIAWYDGGNRQVRYWGGAGAQAFNGGSLQPGQYEVFTFRVRVDADVGGEVVTNVGRFDYRGRDIDGTFTGSTNQVSSVVADVQADLGVSKADTIDPVVAGSTTAYKVTVANNGSAVAQGVVLADTLPDGMAFDAAMSDATCTASGRDVTCALGSMPGGTSRLVTIAVDVDPGAAGSLDNTVTVTSTTPDADVRDNTAVEGTTVVNEAALTLDKVADQATVAAGEVTGYTLAVTNDGPSDALDVEVVDTLPQGMTFVGVPDGCTVSGGDSSVTCDVGRVAAQQVVEVALEVAVASDVADGTALVNTAVVRTEDGDQDEAAASITTTVQADLAVTKGVANSPVVAGGPARFLLGVSNAGPSRSGAAVVTDTLPTGFTFDPGASSSACDAAGQVVTCQVGALAVGATTQFLVVAGTNPTLATGSTIQNTVSIDSDDDPTSANDSATTTVPVQRRADLVVTKTTEAEELVAGGDVTYTVQVRNDGPSVASDIELTDALPASLSLVSAAVTTGPGACVSTGDTTTCAIDQLGVGATTTVALVATVAPDVDQGALVANAATVTAAEADPVPSNNTTTNSTQVTVESGLAIVKDDLDDPALAGGQLRYRITVENLGPSNATNVTVDDLLPTELDFVSAVPSQGTCTQGGAQPQRVTCQLGDMDAGSTQDVLLTTTVDSATADQLQIQNVATASADGAVNVADDSRTLVLRRADLAVAKSGPATVTAGGTVTWTATVTNDGPSVASDVQVVDTLPAGVTITDVGTDRDDDCTADDALATCTLSMLAPDEVVEVTVTGTLAPSLAAGSEVVNQVEASATEDDPVADNDRASATATVARSADVSVTSTDLPDPVEAGTRLVHQVQVANDGPSDASGVVVVHEVPVDLMWVPSASSTACVLTDPGVVTCTVASVIAAGSSRALTMAFDVPGTAADGSQLVATTTVGANEPDPVPANDTTTETTDVVKRADVVVAKTLLTPQPVAAGTVARYRLRVRNAGPSTAEGVEVTDVLPAGLTFVSVADPCAQADGAVTCDVGQLAAGAAVEAVLEATVDAAFSGNLVNTATVTSTTVDPVSSNDTSSSNVSVQRRADLRVAKSATTDAVIAGGTVTYLVEVTNDGPSVASTITMNDTLPAGLSFASAGDPDECVDSGVVVTCTRDVDLPPGETTTFEVTADVAPSAVAGASVANQVTVSATTQDPDPTSNEAAATVTIQRRADLAVEKVALADTVLAGASVAFDITVTNNGPSDATNLVLGDTFSSGLSLSGVSIGDCSTTGPSAATCRVDELAAGDSFTFRAEAYVDPSTAVGATGTNTATVSADELDDVGDNDTSSDDVVVQRSSDLSVDLDGPSEALAGETVTLGAVAYNEGPSDSDDTTVTFTLPTGGTFDPTGSSPGCSAASATVVTCDLGVLEDETNVDLAIRVAFDADAPQGSVTSTAAISGDSPDTDSSGDTATLDTTVGRAADLTTSKSATPDPVAAGTVLRSTIDVLNNGPSSATDVVVRDVLPAGVTLVTTTPGAPDCQPAGAVVDCTIERLGPGESTTVVVDVRANADLVAGTILADTATAIATEDDPDAADNVAVAQAVVEVAADVAISARVDTGAATAGRNVAINHEIVNAGPSVARGAQLRLAAIPGGWTFDAVSSSTECDVAAGAITCDPVDLDPGEAAGWMIVFATASDIADGTMFEVPATALLAGDLDLADNDVTTAGTMGRQVNLGIVKSDDVDPVDAGGSFAYTIVATNTGPSDAANVVVADTLPDDLVLDGVAVTAGDGTCATEGQEVTCTFDDLPVGGEARVRIDVTVLAAVDDGTLIENTATVTSDEVERQPADNSFVQTTRVTQTAGLSVVKQDVVDPAVAGGELEYALTVTNLGPSDASNVQLVDVLPPGLTFVSAVPDVGTCTEAPVGTVTCDLGTLTATAEVMVALTTAVDAGVADATRISNQVTVTGDGADDAVDVAGTTIVRASTIQLDKVGPAAVVAGEQATWTVTVTNDGPSVATGITVEDDIPQGVSPLTGDLDPADAGSCSVTLADVFCTLGDLAPGASVDIVVTGAIDHDVADGATITNVARALLDDQVVRDQATADVDRVADLVVTKVAGTAEVTAGGQVVYTIDVRNDGPSSATGVQVLDVLPDGLELESAVGPIGTCDVGTNSASCDVGGLAVGAIASVVVTATVDTSVAQGTVLANGVSASANEADPDTDSNDAIAPITVDVEADLAMEKVGPAIGVAGGEVTWDLVVTNAGPSDATDVVVTDTLPGGVTLVGDQTTAACTETPVGTVTCELGTVPAGGNDQVSIAVAIPPDAPDESVLDNTAVVSASSPDPDGSNDDATASTTIDRRSDLVMTKSADRATTTAGGQVVYTFAVQNLGPSTATNVLLRDVAPPGITGTGDGPDACLLVGSQYRCTLDDLAPGETASFSLTTNVSPGLPDGSVLRNTSTVRSSSLDEVLDNNASSVEVVVEAVADVNLAKVVDTMPLVAGDTGSFTLTAANAGPSVARNVIVRDTLPDGLQFDIAGSSSGCLAQDQVVTCSVGQLDPDTSSAIVVGVFAAADLADGASLTNTATVTTSTDQVPDGAQGDGTEDDTAVAPVTITREVDLATVKVDSQDPVVAGLGASYTIAVTNRGPSVASDVTITDPLPADVTATDATVVGGVGTCEVTGGGTLVECAVDGLAVDQVATVDVAFTVGPGAVSGATLTNRATAAAAEVDGAAANDVGVQDTGVTRDVGLDITKTVAPAEVLAGEPVTSTIVVSNQGPSAASSVQVVDDLPGTVLDASATVTPPGAGTCDVSPTGLVTCDLEDLAVGEVVDVEIAGTIDPAAVNGAVVVNTATLSSAEAATLSASAQFAVTTEADISITKDGTPTELAGEVVGWTIEVANAGPSTAMGVVVTDAVPAVLTGVRATVVGSGATCSLTGTALRCPLGAVDPGATVQVDLTGTIPPSVAAGTVLTNTARVTTLTDDPDLSNNDSLRADTQVGRSADLAITIDDLDDPVRAGDLLTWVITVANDGPSDASGVLVLGTPPAGVTIQLGLSSLPCDFVSGQRECDVGVVPAGQSRVGTVVVRVDPTTADGTVLTNLVQVEANELDPDLSDNADQEDTTVVSQANVGVVKTTIAPLAPAGGTQSWRLRVTNSGPSTATDVVVVDSLPADTTFVSASDGCTFDAGTIECTVAAMAPLAAVEFEVAAMLDADMTGTLTNSAQVTSASSDPNTTNNTGAVTTPIGIIAEVASATSTDAGLVRAGDPVVWDLSMSSAGPSTATDSRLATTLGLGLEFDAAGSSPDCTEAGGVVTCAALDLAPGAVADFVVATTVAADVADGAVLQVTTVASTATTGDDPADNTSTASVTVRHVADLSVTVDAVLDQVTAGTDAGVFEVTVTSAGPDPAVDVTVTTTLPAGFVFDVAASPPACSSDDGTVVTCVVDLLAVDESIEFALAATVLPQAPVGPATARTVVDAVTFDPDPDGDVDAATSTVTALADLSAGKVATTPVAAGQTSAWEVVVTNDGPSVARDVVVTDTLPDGVTFRVAGSDPACDSSDSQVVVCTLDVVPVGRTTLDIVGVADPQAGDDLVNRVRVRSSTTDPDTDDLGAEATGLTRREVDLDLQIPGDQEQVVQVGDVLDIELVAVNHGPAAALDVEAAVILPPGLGLVSEPVVVQAHTGVATQGLPAATALGRFVPVADGPMVLPPWVDGDPDGRLGVLAMAAAQMAEHTVQIPLIQPGDRATATLQVEVLPEARGTTSLVEYRLLGLNGEDIVATNNVATFEVRVVDDASPLEPPTAEGSEPSAGGAAPNAGPVPPEGSGSGLPATGLQLTTWLGTVLALLAGGWLLVRLAGRHQRRGA